MIRPEKYYREQVTGDQVADWLRSSCMGDGPEVIMLAHWAYHNRMPETFNPFDPECHPEQRRHFRRLFDECRASREAARYQVDMPAASGPAPKHWSDTDGEDL